MPRTHFLHPLCIASCTLLVLHGCAINPQSGEREIILMSEEKEKILDEEAAQQVEAQIGLVEDPELNAYVSEVGQEVASHALRRGIDWRFQIAEMEEPNAFALPGGHIYVSRGLLVLSNSEAELANVLGHEVGHVTARHAAQRDARAKTATALTILSAVAAAIAGEPGAATGLAQFGGLLGASLLAAYSRDQEREADQIGQDLAAQSGIDPDGMARFLNALDDYTRLHMGASRAPGFFDSHPSTPERVAETVTRAQVLRWRPGFGVARTREDFLQKLDGMAVGKPASEGVIEDGRLLHPDLRFALRFPPGWTIVNERSRVFAVAPARDATVMLEVAGPGDDPRAAGAADAQREGLHFVDAAAFKLRGDLEAFRARTTIDGPYGPAAAVVTWVSYEGRIYRLSASATRSRFSSYEGTFLAWARSFRPLADEELVDLSDLRLRLARAAEGETLAELGARVGNEWDATTTAVMNGFVVGRPLVAGTLVKYARREPYVPAPPKAPEGESAAPPS